ncbi:hypothetical protein [Fluviicola sp.]|uniref:hypothetical protein n=1 Tax=Fluviicola sp. TaxID=1917219 RepID=UPI0031D07500
MRTCFIILIFIPFGTLAQRNIGSEFHLSGNHPLIEGIGASFFGGGIGGNVIFRDTNTFGIKTGVEINYFHTLRASQNLSYYHGDNHCVFVTIPAMIRFSTGKKNKRFFEMGAYVGIGSGKSEMGKYSQFVPYSSGVVFTPAISFGGRISLSERIDLLLRPELGLTVTDYHASDRVFETWYSYARFCAGIHVKPKRTDKIK